MHSCQQRRLGSASFVFTTFGLRRRPRLAGRSGRRRHPSCRLSPSANNGHRGTLTATGPRSGFIIVFVWPRAAQIVGNCDLAWHLFSAAAKPSSGGQVKLGKRRYSGDCPMDGHAISFGPFRLLAAQRLLLEGDKPVRLGSRAFDILTALVERAGEVVGKEELIARAWPQTVRRRSESEDPGQRLAPRPRRRPRRPSLRRHRSGTGLQFRRAGTP